MKHLLRYVSVLWLLIIGSNFAIAQSFMNIRMTDGSMIRYDLTKVDSVWFDTGERDIQYVEPAISLGEGYIYYVNGECYNSVAYQCTDFIPIIENNDYYLNIPLPGNNAGLAYYDSDKNYISGENIINDNHIISPDGAKYLRFTIPYAYTDPVLLLPYSLNQELQFTLSNGYIFYKNGECYNSKGYQSSNYIGVEPNKKYYLNVQLPVDNAEIAYYEINRDYTNVQNPRNKAGIAYYDINRNYISGVNSITDSLIITPSDAYYLRFTIPNSFSEQVFLCIIEEDNGYNGGDTIGGGGQPSHEGLVIKNNNQNQLSLLPNGTYLMDSTGAVVDLVENYGHDNKVLAIPVSYTANSTMVVRFRVKFNDDLNKRSPLIDYYAEYPELLNFFTMSGGSHKLRLGVLPDSFKNPDLKAGFESYGQGVGLQGTTKIKAVGADNTSNTDLANVTDLTFDNYRFKTLTGGKLMSVRWLDNTANNADICLSNDGNTLKFYHSSSNSVLYEYYLSNYATLDDLYNAMRTNSQIEVHLYDSVNKTPADLIEFSGIKLVQEREVVDGAGIMLQNYPMKTVYDNAPLYILDKIDDGWHTVEIAADRSLDFGVFCCCVDGTYLYAGINPERISYFDGDTITYFLGGDENGTKTNCSIKDIEIKYDNLEETELVSYNSYSRVQIISDWHPKVYVLEGHNFSDTYEGGQSYDRMTQIFSTLTEKGYIPITLDELKNWVVDGVATHKRMFYAIYDDYQYDIWLDPTLRALHNNYNVKLGLAEITNQTWWNYNGTTYSVSDINDSMISVDWVPLTHTRHQVHNTLGYDDLVVAMQENINDCIAYHIPQIGLVWPGGQTNIMCQELVEQSGWSIAFDIYRTGYYASITDAIKRCDKPMMLPRFVISNRIPINSILQEIQ